MKYEHDMYVDPYLMKEQHIRANAILSRKLHEEEHEQFQKQIYHLK